MLEPRIRLKPHSSLHQSAEYKPTASTLWTFYVPVVLFALVLAWWRFGPILPGTALAGCAATLVILLMRADQSSRGEKTTWSVITIALLFIELCFAYHVHALAECFIVGRLQADNRLTLNFKGCDATLPSVSLFVMDLEGLKGLQAARVEDNARYKPLIQDFPLGDFGATTSQSVPIRVVRPVGQAEHYRLVFYSKQTTWWEDLQISHKGSSQVQAYRVLAYRGLHPKVLASFQDPDWNNNASPETDWTWAAQEP